MTNKQLKENEKFNYSTWYDLPILKQEDKPLFILLTFGDTLNDVYIKTLIKEEEDKKALFIQISDREDLKRFLQTIRYIKEDHIISKYYFCFINEYTQSQEQEDLYTATIKEFKQLSVIFYECNYLKKHNIPTITEIYSEDHKQEQEELQEELTNLNNNFVKVFKENYINDNSIFSKINNFKEKIKKSDTLTQTATGFKNLDTNLFNGGMPKGLLTIGAISSLGKTTLFLQIAEQIAQSRQADILYFSLEMNKEELISKGISRLSFIHAKTINKTSLALNTLGIIQGNRYKNYSQEQLNLIEECFNTYKTYGKHFYIYDSVASEGIGTKEIEDKIREYKEIHQKNPIVIIDYLQIMKSPNPYLTDKQATDLNISTLKRISAMYDTLIICISSLNRASYNERVDLSSFKESGAVEYTNDILIGLNLTAINEIEEMNEEELKAKGLLNKKGEINQNKYKKLLKEAKKEEPRKITLEILKNRNGAIGGSTTFNYYPKYNTFIETNGLVENLTDLTQLLDKSKYNYEQEEGISQELPF